MQQLRKEGCTNERNNNFKCNFISTYLLLNVIYDLYICVDNVFYKKTSQ